MRAPAITVIMLGALMLAGCSASPQIGEIPSAQCRRWLAARGGLVECDRVPERLDAAGRALLGERWSAQITLAVVDADEVAAYSWPGRHIYVTRGLLESVPDDELMAAIAHELGHLIDDGHVRPPFALRGVASLGRRDVESRADAIGCDMLRRAGQDPSAMARLLRRLCGQPGMSPAIERRLAARVERLALGQAETE